MCALYITEFLHQTAGVLCLATTRDEAEREHALFLFERRSAVIRDGDVTP